MYKAIGSRGSRVSRVLWMLEELGQPYEFVEVKLRSPEAYALNPSGKVPILIDGELTVTDSAAICVYLADKHADKGWHSLDDIRGLRRDRIVAHSEIKRPDKAAESLIANT